MGPGDGIQIQRLMDLPTTLETADQPQQQQQQQQHGGSVSSVAMGAAMAAHHQQQLSSSSQSSLSSVQQQQGVQRVKSMFQQSAGKLPSRLPSHQPPPQRSISHNEVRRWFMDSMPQGTEHTGLAVLTAPVWMLDAA